jgi:simple sugar transport system ATP-binding protein
MIMDEPTAALGVPEQRKVLDLVRSLKARGVPVVIVSHNMADVFAVADRLLILRRGRKVGDLAVGETNHNDVVALMIGG